MAIVSFTTRGRGSRTYLYVLPICSKIYLATLGHRPPWILPAAPIPARVYMHLTPKDRQKDRASEKE